MYIRAAESHPEVGNRRTVVQIIHKPRMQNTKPPKVVIIVMKYSTFESIALQKYLWRTSVEQFTFLNIKNYISTNPNFL